MLTHSGCKGVLAMTQASCAFLLYMCRLTRARAHAGRVGRMCMGKRQPSPVYTTIDRHLRRKNHSLILTFSLMRYLRVFYSARKKGNPCGPDKHIAGGGCLVYSAGHTLTTAPLQVVLSNEKLLGVLFACCSTWWLLNRNPFIRIFSDPPWLEK